MSNPLSLSSMPAIAYPRLKIGWAKKHLDTLDKAIFRFLNGDSHRVSTKDDLEAGEYLIILEVNSLPSDLGLMLGDFVSCLRGSLDHLAGELTRVPTGTPNLSASFPVIGVDNADGRKGFKRATVGIAPSALPIIDSLQPHHSGNAYELTKLWQLHRLWNIDKHRRIPFRQTQAQIEITYPPDVTPISRGTDNSGIMRFPLSAKPKIKFNPTIEFDILFGDESEGIVISARELLGIYEFVSDDVFPRFDRFF